MGWLFISLMNNEERVKNKSDKLARQSMALLQRLKSKKEKPSMPANQQNYLDDLYLKVFGKCSPHFDKMATSDELYAQHRRNITRIDQLKQDLQESLREKEELKAQVGKLKQSSDDSAKMKALNIELNRLETIKEENAALIKNLRKENQSLAHDLQQLQQEYHKTTQMNKELELFVESVANDIQSQKRNQAEQQVKNEIQGQVKAELINANEEVQVLRQKLLENEQRLTVITHQNSILKLDLKQAEKDGQGRLQKKHRQWQQQKIKLQEQLAKLQQRHNAEMILANDQSTKYQSRLAIVEEALNEKEQQLQSIHTQHESLKATCERLKAQIDDATKAKQQLEVLLARQRKRLHDKQEEITLSQEENAKLCQSLKRYTEQAQKLQTMLDSHTQTNQKLITRNHQLQQDLVDLGNKLSTNEEHLTAKLEQLKERLKFFKENNETLNNQKVDYITNIEMLADQVKNLSEQVASKDQEIQKMREEYRQVVAAHNKAKSGREQQLQAKLNETIKLFQESMQKKQAQYNALKQQHQRHRDSYSKLEQQSDRQASSLNKQLTRTQEALSTLEGHQEQLQHKIKGQFGRIQRLQLQKHNLQTSLQQQTEQYNQEVTALKPQLQQYKERLDVIRDQRDQLSQEKITLIQESEKMSEANNKLRAQVNEKKLKVHKSEEKICQLNEIINSLSKENTHHEEEKEQTVQIKQTQDPAEEMVQSKCNKHIATINELSSELTQAYKMIQQLEHTVSQLKVNTDSKNEKPQRDSVQKKERGRSIKKIAGIFGF